MTPRLRPLLLCLCLAAVAAAGDEAYLQHLVRETGRMLSELEEEAGRHGARPPAAAADLTARVAALRQRRKEGLAPRPAAEPEVHVVALQEGTPALFGGMRRGLATVKVTCRGRRVLLVLCSRQPIRWDVEAAAGSEVLSVYTAGDARQWVRGVEGGKVVRLGAAAAWERTAPAFVELEESVVRRTGRGIATFQGKESPAEGAAIEVGPGSREWRIQHLYADVSRLHWRATRGRRTRQREAMKRIRFETVYHFRRNKTLATSFGAQTPLGPLLGEQTLLPVGLGGVSQAVRDGRRGALYVIRRGNVWRVHPAAAELQRLYVPAEYPALGEPVALTIDTRRRRLLVASRGRTGYLYAFDLDQERWSVVNDLDGVEAAGLAYDPQRDALFCVEHAAAGPVLHRFTPEGRRVAEVALRLLAAGRPGRALPLFSVAGRLVLLDPPAPRHVGLRIGKTRCYVIDPNRGAVLFSAVQEPFERFDPLAPADLEQLWSELYVRDDARAERAMRELAGGGARAVAFLRGRFRRDASVPPGQVRRWLDLLARDEPLLRGYGQYRLGQLGPAARPLLEKELSRALSPEVRLRLRRALESIEGDGPVSPQRKAELRAIAVLARVDSPAAVDLLHALAAQPDARWRKRADAARQALVAMDRPRR